MTAQLENKFRTKLKDKGYRLDNSAGFRRVVDAAARMSPAEAEKHIADEAREMGVSPKASNNGCFSAAVSVLAIVAAVAVAFGGMQPATPTAKCPACGQTVKTWKSTFVTGARRLELHFVNKVICDGSNELVKTKAVQS